VLLKQLCSMAHIKVVANGIGEAVHPPNAPQPKEPTVVFTGDMAYFPNAQAVGYFARSVLPMVRQRVPHTRFLIVGRNPDRTVQALRSLPGVEVTGTVPDVNVYLSQAQVSAPEDMASAVAGLLCDCELAQRTGEESRRVVGRVYSWDRSLADLLEIIEQAARYPKRTQHHVG
jgi:glycosyltransferase involved in cell wall biosynthesis